MKLHLSEQSIEKIGDLKLDHVIGVESAQFEQLINIFIGIRKSLNSTPIKPQTIFSDKDPQFSKVSKQYNNWWSGTIVNDPKRIKQFKFLDYAPLVFKKIRHDSAVDEQAYRESLGPEIIFSAFFHKRFDYVQTLMSTGKSGSLFYYSQD